MPESHTVIASETVSSVRAEDTLLAPFAGDLPAELHTGHTLINQEHRQVLMIIQRLRQVCPHFVEGKLCTSCSDEVSDTCQSGLMSLLGDLFAFILEHFRHEEKLMRESLMLSMDRELCDAHMEDHAEIATKVQEVVMGIDKGQTASMIRELDVLLHRWLNHHISLHSMMLGQWLEATGHDLAHHR